MHPGPGCLLHHTVVYGNLLAVRVDSFKEDLLRVLRCESGLPAGEEVRYLGEVFFEFFADNGGLPYEYSRVPQEFSAVAENLGKILGRFLGEGLDLDRNIFLDGCGTSGDLNVSVIGIGVSRSYAEGHKDIVFFRIIKGFAESFAEHVPILYYHVTRRHRHDGLGVSSQNLICRVSYAGRGLFPDRLEEQIGAVQIRKLFFDYFAVFAEGDDKDVLFRDDPLAHLVCPHKERLAVPRHVEELLRVVFPAQRPEAVPASSGHYDAVVMSVHKLCVRIMWLVFVFLCFVLLLVGYSKVTIVTPVPPNCMCSSLTDATPGVALTKR